MDTKEIEVMKNNWPISHGPLFQRRSIGPLPSCYKKGPNSQTLLGFGNFPKFKNLSQISFQNPRYWENSQSLITLTLSVMLSILIRLLLCSSGLAVLVDEDFYLKFQMKGGKSSFIQPTDLCFIAGVR